jgi:hypothetical protein
MFKRRATSKAQPAAAPADVYNGLRGQILSLDPASVGMSPTPELPQVWGAMLETGYDSGVATLVALADGTTSLYTSTGGGVIGGGAHAGVVAANRAFLRMIDGALDLFDVESEPAPPAPRDVVIRALTFHRTLAVRAAEADLGNGRLPASAVFHAAHAVITELRLIN